MDGVSRDDIQLIAFLVVVIYFFSIFYILSTISNSLKNIEKMMKRNEEKDSNLNLTEKKLIRKLFD